MTVQFVVDIRNAWLDSIESLIGASAILKIRSGAKPAFVTDPDAGDVLATVNLPADWMNAASGGVKTKSGTWQDLTADDDGIAGHFRIYASDGTTVKAQGTYGIGGTDMVGDSTNFVLGQAFTINTFTLRAGNG